MQFFCLWIAFIFLNQYVKKIKSIFLNLIKYLDIGLFIIVYLLHRYVHLLYLNLFIYIASFLISLISLFCLINTPNMCFLSIIILTY